MSAQYDVAVVGGGIAGASLTFFLTQRGLRVALLERGKPASGGTGLSAAIVRQHYSTELMARLAMRSVQIFQDAHRLLGRDAGYRKVGYVFLAAPDLFAATERNVSMQRKIGIETRLMDPRELKQSMPWLNIEGVAGGAFERDGGFADPETATTAFIDAAREKGAEVHTQKPVRSLLRSGDRIEGVLTDAGEITSEFVVNAAGPWSAPLAASAGIELEMRTVREQDSIWEARQGGELPQLSVSNAVDAIYIRPLGERRFIVGRGFPKQYQDVDPYNYKKTADDDFVADVNERLTRRVPSFEGARLVNSYAALYDVTLDWYQYVGPRTHLSGYVDFCGGSGHGFKVAPAIAEELASWIAEDKVAKDFRRLSYDRVGNKDLFVQSYGGNRG
jgi:sarcosine oxidase subunit beta